ncbi:DNA modification methylase [Methanomethylophilus alvi]|uniref:DNA modification methylase n=1 Tax=Methanomethylophilus alvi TaxID=1291540 RepID=UPI0037DCAFE5
MNNSLNAICPYFAMYPLDYPMGVIEKYGATSVLDPFCGRGTTNMAARLNNIHSVGIDSSDVAYAISSAKMVNTSPESILRTYDAIVSDCEDVDTPTGEFWDMMYDPVVLKTVCTVRKALLEECASEEEIALRGIMLGALHGPMMVNGSSSYFSNQFPRTFASKPSYSVRYWKKNDYLKPPNVDVREIVKKRAHRYYSNFLEPTTGFILKGDSTDRSTFDELERLNGDRKFDTIITSPPYHGMNTYIPDQWLRNWFVGGPDSVEYTMRGQTSGRLNTFIKQLKSVWNNCKRLCSDDARMFVRFGEIGNKTADPGEIIRKTFEGTDWIVDSIEGAGMPKKGRRSSELFLKTNLSDYKEIDVQVSVDV